ncbi:hypothetical protein ACXGQW_00685 [Wenyingzhuangia sp. IMCC45533]
MTSLLLGKLSEFEKLDTPTPYWHLLLILKWNLEFSEKNYKSKPATIRDLKNIIKKIDELEMSHQTFLIKKNHPISKTFTILASQQFIYQHRAYWDTFARQLIIFNDLKHKYDISNSFYSLTGIKLEEFVQISKLIWLLTSNFNTKIFKYDGYLSNNLLKFITAIHKPETIKLYIDLLSVSKETIKKDLLEDSRVIRNYNLQPFETSFFTRKPFLFYKGKYIIPYKDILQPNFSYFIYEYLKSKDPEFTTEFGMRLEKYVKLGLKENHIKLITENELKLELGIKNNLVDYIIEENILIEVKAIEIKPYVSINPKDNLLANEFRKNLVKAYAKQMINVANKLNKFEEYFGVIITYKNLYLGNSFDIWEQFLKEETLKICTNEDLRIIPIENLFFIDIKTWDILMQVVKNEKITIKEILTKIKATDSVEKTKKFTLRMHLDEYNIENFDLEYLLNADKKLNNK